MSMCKSVLGAGCITMVLALSTGCGNGAEINSSGAGGMAQPSATTAATAAVSVTPSPAPATPAVIQTEPPVVKSVALIPAVLDYTESGRGYVIKGEVVQATFSADQILPLGLFMPETMVRFEQDGRTARGTPDKQNYITLIKLDGADTAAGDGEFGPGNDLVLLKYKEYLGSKVEESTVKGSQTAEAFKFTAKDQAYRAEIHIQDEQRTTLLPVFIDMLRAVEYMKKQPPITPGVFLTAPDVGSDPGKKQALQETMDCLEAWAAGDKEKFDSTLYSPQLNEALQFFLDHKNVYHFSELTVRGIPMEGAKRAAFIVSYTRMTSEGYIVDGANEISLLKNKQGEWKIASID
ncbi:hypothetical protein [Paenibacillus sp. FSL H8-0259]|uniref:hypothetical protein n=1 Tax=Paenibacillus sp. FSL H8-0259 TaxID=1920423 RepID=UPI00097017FB|nr:hypothetical protein [Paenibacillus sp. FSL H8-0259]OMF31127.1 hypothetical protein BK132_06805 [Paenibacillus sp. FSL H8-0259]